MTKEHHSEYMRKWRQTAHAKEWRRLYVRRRRQEWKALGLCVVCGSEPLKTVSHGVRCLMAKRAYRSTDKAKDTARAYKRLPKSKAYDSKYKKCDTKKVKLAAFLAYGGVGCVCCGESTSEFLSIDHISGWRNMSQAPRGGGKLYRWLRRNKYPSGFQVLCFNCNFAKGHFGQCPHKKGDSPNIREQSRL